MANRRRVAARNSPVLAGATDFGRLTGSGEVLGLGNIGPLASKPVMEGKAVLFKKFAGIDVFDIEIAADTIERVVETVAALEPTFGGINLEDIKGPECFEIEAQLKARMKIPVFHYDQHGTAIIVGAAITNALLLNGKNLADVKIVASAAVFPPTNSPTVLLVRKALQDGGQVKGVADLKGRKVAVAETEGSAGAYLLARALQTGDRTIHRTGHFELHMPAGSFAEQRAVDVAIGTVSGFGSAARSMHAKVERGLAGVRAKCA